MHNARPQEKPISAAVSPDGTRAYVASSEDNGDEGTTSFMNVIDTETNELVEDTIDLIIAGAGAIVASPESAGINRHGEGDERALH